jgi:hypothetical protein|tara:strand:+ start:303 stop:485 length:183 start_codon:yes stop_codon:yes gene_type:complete
LKKTVEDLKLEIMWAERGIMQYEAHSYSGPRLPQTIVDESIDERRIELAKLEKELEELEK